MKIELHNIQGQVVGEVELPSFWFEQKPSVGFLHEVVTAYLANRRRGTACTKTRSEVSGGGRKPWKQKGTGRARQGSTRSPLWRKGGVVFGPKPRDYGQNLSKRKKVLALAQALSAKVLDQQVQVVQDWTVDVPKTQKMHAVIRQLGVPSGSLLILSQPDPKLHLAGRNLQSIRLVRVEDLNAYQVLGAHRLVWMESALKKLSQRNEHVTA